MAKTKIIISSIYLKDLNSDSKYNVLGEVVIGRSDGTLNFPSDNSMSRKHLRIVPTDEVVLIEDLGSTNQSSVNKRFLVPKKLYKLTSRDVIECGSQKLQILIGGEVQEPSNEKLKEPDATDLSSGLQFEDFVSSSANIVHGERIPQLSRLLDNKNTAWYLQFEGSEFGPLTQKELETTLRSQKFQGGTIFVWAEGIENWAPVAILQRALGISVAEVTSTKKVDRSFALVATVYLFLDAKRMDKIMGSCESISTQDILVSFSQGYKPTNTALEIEVNTLSNSGIDRFRVKVLWENQKFGAHVFKFQDLPVKVRAQIEKVHEKLFTKK